MSRLMYNIAKCQKNNKKNKKKDFLFDKRLDILLEML